MSISLSPLTLHRHCTITRYPPLPQVPGRYSPICSSNLGQKAPKEYHCPHQTDKKTRVQRDVLTSPRPHGERVRRGGGLGRRPQTSCPQPALRLRFPTWRCRLCFRRHLGLAPLGMLTTQAGVLLEPWEMEPPDPGETGRRQGSEGGNPGLSAPTRDVRAAPLFPRIPVEAQGQLQKEKTVALMFLIHPRRCVGPQLKPGSRNTMYPRPSRHLPNLGNISTEGPQRQAPGPVPFQRVLRAWVRVGARQALNRHRGGRREGGRKGEGLGRTKEGKLMCGCPVLGIKS